MIAYSVKLAIECASRRARVCLHIHTSPGLLRRTAMPARHADREAARLIRHRHTAPDVGPSGSAINCNATPLVGLIVSATLERYQRAASVVDLSALRLPAAERGWRRRAATADARPRLLRAREAVQSPGGV